MTTRFLLAATAALTSLSVLAACGSADDAAPEAEATTAMMDTATPEVADPALPVVAQGFVAMAAASDMFEVEAGKLAQANGKSDAIKEFGAMMVTDHTKSTADLKAAAAQVDGVQVVPMLSVKQQADLGALKGAGESFDDIYKRQQVAAHQQALVLLKNFAAAGDAQPLKDFAGKAVPVVQTHLDHVEMLP
jgi:putative membrane protein